jgi:hypothetical protein
MPSKVISVVVGLEVEGVAVAVRKIILAIAANILCGGGAQIYSTPELPREPHREQWEILRL